MSIEDRLRRELHDTAEQLIVRPDDYERVVRIGKRRKRVATLTGAAASLMVAVVGVVALSTLRSDPNPPVGPSTSPPSTTTTPSPAPVRAWETTGVAVAGSAGITTYGLDGSVTAPLTSDPFYETVSWALADGAGGLVFVHEITPLPWEQGSIMWLPAGESQPRPLIAPGPGELMTPLEMIDGTMTLLYRYDHRGGSEIRTLDLKGPTTDPFIEVGPYFFDAAADGDVLAVVSGDPCLQVNFFLISGGGPIDVGFGDECLPPITAVAMAGGFLYTLEDGESGRQLVVRHLGTGERVDAIDAGDAWSLEVAPDGVVAFGGETVTLGRFSEGLFDRWASVPGGGTVSLIDTLDLAGARLGSGSADLPCTPHDQTSLPDQGLPAPVEETRDAIFAAAAACDFETLSRLVVSNETNLWFGSREDPIRTWIRAARNGEDPLGWMVRILNADPAFSESEGGSYYAWPAVHITNSEGDWEALSGILTAAEYEQLYQFRESGYLGYRIGIGADGRWWFALAGD